MSANRIVIVADDDEEVRAAIESVLGRAGYETRSARNGHEALLALDGLGGRPCILVLDLMMHEMDGFEVLAVLARTHRLATVPVIVCSAAWNGEPLPPGIRLCLLKPMSMDALLGGLENLCRQESARGWGQGRSGASELG